MNRLKTNYLNLELKNPLIVASSPLTSDIDKLKKCEDNNCSAVVLPSIFEEDINYLTQKELGKSNYYSHSDAYTYLEQASSSHFLDSYFNLIEKAKQSLDIPVIASINCNGMGTWVDYVKTISSLNVDALEINHFKLPSDATKDSSYYLDSYTSVIKSVRKHTKLPIALKLGAYFTDVAHVLKTFSKMDIQGLVLFNRFFQTDIDINKKQLTNGSVLSSKSESYLSLLWTALSSGELEADICGNTGIYDSETILKFILSGAKATELCSVFMKNKIEYANTLVKELDSYCEKNDTTIEKLCGILAQESINDPQVWERVQYLKAIHS